MKAFRKTFKLIAFLLVITLLAGNSAIAMADDLIADVSEEVTTNEQSDADTDASLPEESDESGVDEEANDIVLSDENSDSEEETVLLQGDENETGSEEDPAQTEQDPEDIFEEPAEEDQVEVSDVETEDPSSEENIEEAESSEAEENVEMSVAETGEEDTECTVSFTLKSTDTNVYRIALENLSAAAEYKAVKAKVWSNAKGEDDAKWLTLKKRSGNVFSVTSYIKDFKNYGKATAEVYLEKEDGTTELIGKDTLYITAPKIGSSKIDVDAKKSTLTVSVSDFSSDLSIDSVKACVWRKADQSDLQWYTMRASGTTYKTGTVSLYDFGGYSGNYYVRVLAYPTNGNPKLLVNKTKVEIKESKGSVSCVDKNEGKEGQLEKSYRVSIKGLTNIGGISSVEFEVWPVSDSTKKQVFEAKKNKYGTYFYTTVPINKFKTAGEYRAKIYVVQPDGERVYIRTKKLMTVTGDAGGTIVQENKKPQKGTFVLSMDGFTAPSGTGSVKFKVWTQDNKKDKYIYAAVKQSDGSFKATVNIKNHKYNDGTFHVQPIVVMKNKVKDMQDPVDIEFKAQNLTFVMDKEKGRITVGIVGPSPKKNVKFAVWGEKDGQADLQWYQGTKSGNTYTAQVTLFNHNETGKYNVHAYSGDNFLGSKTFNVKKKDLIKNGYFYENGLKMYYVDGVLQTNYRGKVKGPYQVCVNRQCCTITVYAKDGDNGFIQPISYFACSVGMDWAPTPTGIFHLSSRQRWKHFYTWDTYVQYACRYSTGRFFHSVTCTAPSIYALDPASYNMLGSPASHGCIRLTVKDAKWMYENIKDIAEVKIYDSPDPGPFGKATAIKIPPTQTWDPTDPAVTQ